MTQDENLTAAAGVFARRAAENIRADGRDWLWTMENGIVIRCSSIPSSYLSALREAYPPPKPPSMPGAGGRPEEVPDHPDFIVQLAAYTVSFEEQQNRLIWGLATKVESIPEGMYGPDRDEWIDQVRKAAKLMRIALDVEVEDPDLRYCDWLRFYAADNERDAWIISHLPQKLAGLTYTEVRAAAEAFRHFATRGADSQGPAIRSDANGDHDRKPDRGDDSGV